MEKIRHGLEKPLGFTKKQRNSVATSGYIMRNSSPARVCQPRYCKWTHVERNWSLLIYDFTYYNRKVYCIDGINHIRAWDVHVKDQTILVDVSTMPNNFYREPDHLHDVVYLIGLDDGERKRLLVVIRKKQENENCDKTKRFLVFAYDLETNGRRNIGKARDMGIYRMSDETIEPHFLGESLSHVTPLVWLQSIHDDPNEESSDADQEDRSKGKDHVGQDEPATILVDEEVQVVAADKPKGIRKKRRATGGASGSNHPLKKLRKDHGTSSNVNASTGGKYLAAIQCLLKRSTLNVEAGLRQWQLYHSSHHFSANAADVEVSSFVTSSILPPLVMTVVVTTTVIADTSSVPVLRADAKLVTQVYQSPFANSTSVGTVGPNIAGPSNLVGTKFYTDAFYVSQEMDYETLHQIYVPKCNVVNEFILDDPDVCRSVVDQLAPWTLFLALRERKRFKRRCVRQVDMLKERDVEIANDAQLKEVKIRVAGLDYELMALALYLDNEFYPCFLTTIAGRQWIIGHGLRLAIMRCHQSPEYAAAFVVVVGLTIDKGIQAGLVAGIDHEKSRRGLAVVASYDPFVEASIADIMNSLCLEGPSAETLEVSWLQPAYEQILLPIYQKEDNVVLKRLLYLAL
uniref:KIB1-4 beta-propeller domain-containing protein n=1 Tax=Tanacetum cinerariifolium TaxID=118510 RepID=A0A6L2K0G6_TANCI|nr:hypothetical protein [Tanacetum cinerariifolium]